MTTPILPALIKIPAGPVRLGCVGGDREATPDEYPAALLNVPAFALAQTPVTTEEFLRFVETGRAKPRRFWGGLRPPPGIERHPVINVSWADAKAYCDWLAECSSKPYRLPTELEWERAASGAEEQRWPWGNEFDPLLANTREAGRGKTVTVDAQPEAASPFGVLDLAGNAWEWTSDVFRPYPYQSTLESELPPLAPGEFEDSRRVLRGGSCMAEAKWSRCSARVRWQPLYIFSGHVGFRVACGE